MKKQTIISAIIASILWIGIIVIACSAKEPANSRLDQFDRELNMLMNKYPEIYESNVEILWYDSDASDGYIYTWTWEAE